jgi:integrase
LVDVAAWPGGFQSRWGGSHTVAGWFGATEADGMSALATHSPVTALGPILREADRQVKDKSYQRSPIGQEVKRYLRAFRWAGNELSSADSYESVLARFAVDHDDFGSLEEFASPLGAEYALAFLDRHWSEASRATQGHHLAVVKSFLAWAVGEGRMAYSPIATVKAPKRRRAERSAYPRDVIDRLVAAQDSLRDQCALQLLARMGLRKNELRLLKVGEIDLTRNLLVVHGKGGHVQVMPLAFKGLCEDLYLHINGERRRPAEYLVYPKRDRLRPMDHSTVHRWFKRCLENAELPETVKLHEMRHTAGDEIWRVTGNIVMAKELLRHSSVKTTEDYLHPSREDLAAGMRAVEESLQGSK